MKKLILALNFISVMALSQVPEPVITDMSSAHSHATIAGRLNSKPTTPVGVSVQNGGIMYSTITDLEGRWAIVIRHRSVNVGVASWNLADAQDRFELQTVLPTSK